MNTPPHTNLFTQVDRTKDPDFFVRFMDEAQKPAGIRASKRLMLERAPLAAGAAVLEVGCGPGTDLFDVAGIVGSSGRLVGVDASEVMIAEARRRAAELGVAVIRARRRAGPLVPRRDFRRMPRAAAA
jgi:cyclopropane fatty-acyl-phospholipid synthase-like methyltransferase